MRKAVFTGTAEELNKYANDPKIKINMQMMQMLNKNQNIPERRNILTRKWSFVVLGLILNFLQKSISGLPRGMEEALDRNRGLLQV